jgi:hypothetical protein
MQYKAIIFNSNSIDNSDDDEEFSSFSGGICCVLDKPTKEQENAGDIANKYINKIFNENLHIVNSPTFDINSTDSAKQYISIIHTFECIQNSFFEGFLKNKKPESLDDYFMETLI